MQRGANMFLVTTPTGNSGKYVLREALKSGKPIRVFVRNAKKIPEVLRQQCEIVEGDLRDEVAFKRAAAGVESVFFCTPQSGEMNDVAEYYRIFSEPAAKVFKECGVKRVVTISGGRGNPKDLGPSGPLAQMENRFDATGIATRHLRCGLFMEGVYWWIPQMKFTGTFSLPVEPNYKIAMESAYDIGQTAAKWLLDTSWNDQKGVDVQFHDSLSPVEIAETLTRVLNKKIVFKPITGEDFKNTLIKYGVSPAMGQCLKEMYAEIDNGSLKGARSSPSQSGLSLEQWAKENLVSRMTWISVMKRLLFKVEN
jgi:uncharacterized protein YbjT (DUF2867 family)